jgi:hypothetical protein
MSFVFWEPKEMNGGEFPAGLTTTMVLTFITGHFLKIDCYVTASDD